MRIPRAAGAVIEFPERWMESPDGGMVAGRWKVTKGCTYKHAKESNQTGDGADRGGRDPARKHELVRAPCYDLSGGGSTSGR